MMLKKLFLLAVLFTSACATSRGADQNVLYKPQNGEEIPAKELKEQKLVAAVDAEIAKQASASKTLRNALGKAEIQEAMKLSPAYFFSSVTLEPVQENGKFIGYRVKALSPKAEEICNRFDERPEVNDILVSINGIRFKTPDDFMKLWGELDKQDYIKINLLRGVVEGSKDNSQVKPISLTWPIQP